MTNLTFYRILTFILLPIAGLFGLMAAFALLVSLANPTLLLGTFMLSAVVIYVFTAFKFYTKGIRAATPLKANLKDWIKVNAFVAVAFASLSLMQSVGVLGNPAVLNDAIKQSSEMQQKMSTGVTVSPDLMLKVTKAVLYFMIAFSVVLLTHIFITFRLLTAFKHVFDKPQN
jgi:hypothetical protein